MSAIRTQPARASGWASALWPALLYALAAGDPDAVRHPTTNSANTPDAASAANASEPTAPFLESFEVFFQYYQQDIFGYLWRMTGEEQAAYDLSQETFLRAWQRFERIRDYDQPGAWLFRVATNLALNHLNRRRLAARFLGPLGPLGAHAGEPASDPTARLADDAQVREILLALPPRPRAVLVLHDVYGFSTEEIGDTLGMTLAAVRMMLCRARERFRLCYRSQEAHE